MIRLLRWLARWLYGFRATNEQVLRTPGPVLLVPNHHSLLDWLFVGVCLETDWKFVVSSVTAQRNWLFRFVMLNRRTFPIDTLSPYAARHMAEYLHRGGRLVLFAEGRMSRTGSLMKLFEGTGFLLHKTQAKVITAYLRGAQWLPWTVHRNRTTWWPRVSVHFSDLLEPPRVGSIGAARARTLLTTWLRDQMLGQQFDVETRLGPGTVLRAVEETARLRRRQIVLEDVTRQPLTYGRLMLAVEVLTRQWGRWLEPLPGGRRVGVLLPNVNAMPIVIISLWRAGRVPSILNYSTGMVTMLNCVQLAGLRQVITSRAFVERAKLDLQPLAEAGTRILYLEDVRGAIPARDKLWAGVRHGLRLRPRAGPPRPDDTALILFTSGSEGMPKGVELTHANLMANLRQVQAMADLQDHDRFFNALPLFHSFGITMGALLPLVRGLYVFIYPSPLHYRVIPTILYDRACTLFLATNTFLNGYARRAHPYDFHNLRYLFAGAEKVQNSTAELWARRFGVRILEGYGATECSPVISVNTWMQAKHESAGRFVPRLEHRIEPVEGIDEGGRLWVRGPNVMRGYLNPEANARFQAQAGWYDTGDVAKVDAEGFVFLLGRLKRFAKVSGEMISLTALEDALAGAFPQYGLRCEVAVVSQPDEDKGEALLAVTNEPRLRLEEVRAAIKARGFSNLCVPRDLKVLRDIPKLGTGKVNHRELAKLL